MLFFGVRSFTATAQIVAYFVSVLLFANMATEGQVAVFVNTLIFSPWSVYQGEIPAPVTVQVLATPCVAAPASPPTTFGPPSPAPLSAPSLLPPGLNYPVSVPSPVEKVSPPSLGGSTISLSALADLVLTFGVAVMAGVDYYRAAQRHKSSLLAAKRLYARSFIKRLAAEYAAKVELNRLTTGRCAAEVSAVYLTAARKEQDRLARLPWVRSPLSWRSPVPPPRPPRPARRSRCTENAKRKPIWLEVIAEEF